MYLSVMLQSSFPVSVHSSSLFIGLTVALPVSVNHVQYFSRYLSVLLNISSSILLSPYVCPFHHLFPYLSILCSWQEPLSSDSGVTTITRVDKVHGWRAPRLSDQMFYCASFRLSVSWIAYMYVTSGCFNLSTMSSRGSSLVSESSLSSFIGENTNR